MGAAGDMFMATLLDLLPAPENFIDRLNRLGIPGITYFYETSVKCGITGTHVKVTWNEKEEVSQDYLPGDRMAFMTHNEHSHIEGDDHSCSKTWRDIRNRTSAGNIASPGGSA